MISARHRTRSVDVINLGNRTLSEQLQLRSDTASNILSFTGAQGEIVIDTTNNRIVGQDGATLGGFPAAKLSEVITNPRTSVPDADYPLTAPDDSSTPGSLRLYGADRRAHREPAAASTYPTGTQAHDHRRDRQLHRADLHNDHPARDQHYQRGQRVDRDQHGLWIRPPSRATGRTDGRPSAVGIRDRHEAGHVPPRGLFLDQRPRVGALDAADNGNVIYGWDAADPGELHPAWGRSLCAVCYHSHGDGWLGKSCSADRPRGSSRLGARRPT